MKVLVVGNGGREHALAWKIAQSPKVDGVICAPGNGGTGDVAENVAIPVADHAAILRLCRDRKVDLAVVGPELPLVAGLADKLRAADVRVFGPGADGAQLEGSKIFAKTVMQRYVIPTAPWRAFSDLDAAGAYLESLRHYPVVIKADGLAAGKGVVLPGTFEEALDEARAMLEENRFGEAGHAVVIEECLRGRELSVLALTDGRTLAVLETAQDHKRALDGDQGANTGGMGAFSPSPAATDDVMREVTREVLVRAMHGLARERIDYRGVLYAGLMLTRGGVKALEFNCRFGDPEVQVVLRRMQSDIVPLLAAVADGKLAEVSELTWDPRPAVGVVMASRGYPQSSSSGDVIGGLARAQSLPDVEVFHAGTARDGERVVTAGGRVLCVTALGDTLADARAKAYAAVDCIAFEGMHFRTDIAAGV